MRKKHQVLKVQSAQEGGAQEGGAQAAISPHTRQWQWCDSIPLSWRRLLSVNFLLFHIWKVRGEAKSRRYFLEMQSFVDKC